MAKLHFKYGAMNCGKSDTLIKNTFNYREQELSVMVIKPETDTKDRDHKTARAGGMVVADLVATLGMNLREGVREFMVREALRKLNCVLVDEAQFLEPEQIGQLYRVAKIDDISVIAFGLRTDFRAQLFPGSDRLMALADNIEEIITMCKCGSQAKFNCRMLDGVPVFEGDQVAIDGEGATTYDSKCGQCYVSAGGTL